MGDMDVAFDPAGYTEGNPANGGYKTKKEAITRAGIIGELYEGNQETETDYFTGANQGMEGEGIPTADI